MKFSKRWLDEFLEKPTPTDELVRCLTMGGLEVDAVTPAAGDFDAVVVGMIESVEAHPNADKLRLCLVNDGERHHRIVCGAANARAGLKAPFARPGARLPNGVVIAASEVRGERSEGMLCSAAELGLTEAVDGLLELDGEAPPGADLRAWLQLDDECLELDLTPNRGDCLGVYGIARDVSVLTASGLKAFPQANVAAQIDDKLDVTLSEKSACPRYAGRVIKGIDAKSAVPFWLSERLRRSGLRSISAVVDITNYILLELGQPMHAFDLDKLQGGINVRLAREGEKLTVLDMTEAALETDTLVIADDAGPVAIAGIMGGLDTAVSGDTRNVFLESAFFSPKAMAGKARRYKLQTDSSHRFERGVDYALQTIAIERATALIVEICGGEPGPVIDRRIDEELPRREAITLRAERIKRLLGIDLSAPFIGRALRGLGMHVSEQPGVYQVTPPSFRFDIAIEADLIEELARVFGYGNIPNDTPRAGLSPSTAREAQVSLTRLKSVLVFRGYHEAITYSFVEPELQRRVMPALEAVPLANPISSDMAVMRTSLIPGLLQALIFNQRRQHERIRLFEAGLVFCRRKDGLQQEPVIGGICAGPALPKQWGSRAREVDFHDVKGDVEALLAWRDWPVTFAPSRCEAFHPGQSAGIFRERSEIGFVAALHPELLRDLDLDKRVFVFQLLLPEVCKGQVPSFVAPSKFPLVRRDISIVVADSVPAAVVLATIEAIAPKPLIDFQLFDLYTGEGIDYGEKSLALGLTFQGLSSTLIDSEIDELVDDILSGLNKKLGSRLRE